MADAKFEKVTRSDKSLYGPEKLVLCGFPAGAHGKFETILKMAGMQRVPVVWAGEPQAQKLLSEIFDLPGDFGRGTTSKLPRAVIVAGITENMLHTLMTLCRKSGMKQALWATLTPTSETWTLSALLAELSEERRALKG
jgi:hypothetical protein